MIRRDFLKTSIVGVVAAGFPKLSNALTDDYGDTVEYKGYKLHFNGFFGSPDSTRVSCCWWAACKTKDSYGHTRFFYATTPGIEGCMVSGSIFNLVAIQENGIFQPAFLEDYLQDPELAQKVKLDTLKRLKIVIDAGEDTE